MDTLTTPFLAANKLVTDWHAAQVKLVAGQTASMFDLYRTSLDATVAATHGMTRTVMAAWVPAADAGASPKAN